MSSQLRLRRGSSSSHASFTGADGEVTFNTDTNSLTSHDGATVGGFPGGGYVSAGSGSIQRSVESKLQETVSLKDKGGIVGADSTAALIAALAAHNTVRITDGEYLTSGITVSTDKTIIFDGGSIKSLTASSRFAEVLAGAKLTLINPNLVGYRLTDDTNKSNDGIVVTNGTLVIEGTGTIKYFAGFGVFFVSGGGQAAISTIGSGITITENGGGIYTGNYEYFSFDGCTVTNNGLNVAKTNWSNVSGASTGWGIAGSFANGAIKNCTVNGNAIGIELNSIAGTNPDHGKIVNNTINHNLAAGLIVENLHNYETIVGNTILSNVVSVAAPTVTFAATGTSFDYIEVNCIGLQVAFNDIGVGSGGAIPIYGHGRCRYIGNNLIGAPFSEIAHPQVGSKLYDFYGYNKNGDNLFIGNMIRNGSTAGLSQIILNDSVRTVVTYDILSSGVENNPGVGSGKLIDGVKQALTYINSWEAYNVGQTAWVSRKNGNEVSLYIYTKQTTITVNTPICTLPAEYRPASYNLQCLAATGNSLAHTYATVGIDGNVTVVGAIQNEPVLINVTYSTTL